MFDRLSIYGIDPVMSAADSVQARLFTLADALRQIQQLISRLAKTSSSSSHNSHADHVEGRLELADEIHSALKEQEEDFELLQQDFSYHRDRAESASRGLVEKDSGEVELATRIAKHAEDLKMYDHIRFVWLHAQSSKRKISVPEGSIDGKKKRGSCADERSEPPVRAATRGPELVGTEPRPTKGAGEAITGRDCPEHVQRFDSFDKTAAWIDDCGVGA